MSTIRRIHVPLREPEDIIPHLGAKHHWREGRSAKSLVDQWWRANALPASVIDVLAQATEWQGATLVDAFAERCTNLEDGRPSHSQSDMLAIVAIGEKLGLLCIEGKVDEGFDKLVEEWLSDNSVGKQSRLKRLCSALNLNSDRVGHLRYQLLHRTVSGALEASRYRSKQAFMLVQSWSTSADSWEDFSEFSEALGIGPVSVGRPSRPFLVNGIRMRIAWSDESIRESG
jgi:hypothetical protein